MKRTGSFKPDTVLRLVGMTVCGALCLTGCMKDGPATAIPGQTGDGVLHFSAAGEPGLTGIRTRSGEKAVYAGTLEAGDGNGDAPLYLHASVSEGINACEADGRGSAPQTRSIPKTQDDFHKTIGLFGYSYDKTAGFSSGSLPEFMYNVKATRDEDNQDGAYETDDRYYVPGGNTEVCFFGYSPMNWNTSERGNDPFLTVPDRTEKGVPQFRYKLPLIAANQTDLCFSRRAVAQADGKVPMTFDHAMTAILFVADPSLAGAVIHQITISGVYANGTWTPSMDNGKGRWSSLQGSGTYTILETDDTPPVTVSPDNETKINGEYYFFMLPQEFNDGHPGRIAIDITPSGGARTTRNITLTGQTWQPGTTVTYRLSSSGLELLITPLDSTGTGFNGTDAMDFTVTSKKGANAVNYSIQFSDTGEEGTWVENVAGTRPAMIADSKKTSNGDGTWSHRLKIGKGPYFVDGSDAKILQGTQWAARANVTGLIPDGNSANCYIVSRAGYHRFQAVYGNALKGGKTNSAVMGKYTDGRGQTINAPALPDGIKIRLIWEDVEGLVKVEETPSTSSGTGTGTGDNKYIYFTVGGSQDTFKSFMQPGNALIGAYLGETLVWSWHIWVTPKPGTGKPANSSFTFMDRPIGFVQGGRTKAMSRKCYMRAYATADNKVQYSNVIEITQNTDNFSATDIPGRYPTFQWGRKEPMWPSNSEYSGGPGMPLYGPGAPDPNQNPPAGALTSPAMRINNPAKFSTSIPSASNLWNAAASGEGEIELGKAVTKSIYDPSPANYHVPQDNAFAGNTWVNENITHNEATTDRGGVRGILVTNISSSSAGLTNNGVYLPFGGARLQTYNFIYQNSINSYYGGSWTAGRRNIIINRQAVLRPILCYMRFGQDIYGISFAFWPRYALYTSTTADMAYPTNAYSILPQYEAEK